MKKLVGMCVVLVVLLSFAGCYSGRGIYGGRPVARVMVIPPSPGPGYVWRSNAWRWGGGRRYMVAPPYGYSYGYRGRGRY